MFFVTPDRDDVSRSPEPEAEPRRTNLKIPGTQDTTNVTTIQRKLGKQKNRTLKYPLRKQATLQPVPGEN